MKLPSIQHINAHVWRMAQFVHPIPRRMDRLSWINKVLLQYGVQAETIDGQLDYQQAYDLWNGLMGTEMSRAQAMMELLQPVEQQELQIV